MVPVELETLQDALHCHDYDALKAITAIFSQIPRVIVSGVPAPPQVGPAKAALSPQTRARERGGYTLRRTLLAASRDEARVVEYVG